MTSGRQGITTGLLSDPNVIECANRISPSPWLANPGSAPRLLTHDAVALPTTGKPFLQA